MCKDASNEVDEAVQGYKDECCCCAGCSILENEDEDECHRYRTLDQPGLYRTCAVNPLTSSCGCVSLLFLVSYSSLMFMALVATKTINTTCGDDTESGLALFEVDVKSELSIHSEAAQRGVHGPLRRLTG